MKKSIRFMVVPVLLAAMPLLTVQAQQAPGASNLPALETTLFAGSGVCARCHEGLFENGVDVSPVTLWRSTMMANAAKDPLWRAKVSREVVEFQYLGLQAVIEQKCIKCHAPALYKQAVFEERPYSIAELENDRLAKDGDTCTVCHQILPDNFGQKESFSGKFMIWRDPDEALRTIFGPYPDPLVGPMLNNAGYTPELAYLEPPYVIDDAEHCATCHNLFTNYVDKHDEIPTGQVEFPEQTPYYEWKNSIYYSGTSAKTCQGCHMPQAATSIRISTAGGRRIALREPFWYHYFVGGNRLMATVLKDNIDLLGATATEAHFDTTLANTADLLQNETIDLAAGYKVAGSKLIVDVTVTNKAGHKLPTGIPLRRVWIHLKVEDGTGGNVFESGAWDASTGEIAGLGSGGSGFEPHYDTITHRNEVQVYEGVMMDDWGKMTRLLLRARDFIKDNRLPPKGFSKDHKDYGYIRIVGAADGDDDFNVGGNGADTVRYEIPIGSSGGPFTVTVEVCYQTVTPAEVSHLAEQDTPEIQLFGELYAAADKAPVIMRSLVLNGVQ